MVPLTGTRRWVFELGTEEHKRKRTHWRHWTDPRGQVGRDGVEGRGLVCMRPARLSLPLQQHRWLPSPGPASGYPPGAAPYAALGWWAALCPSSNPPCHAVSSVPYAALKQVGGDLEEYQDFTFLTLRRAGHEAPYTGGGGRAATAAAAPVAAACPATSQRAAQPMPPASLLPCRFVAQERTFYVYSKWLAGEDIV